MAVPAVMADLSPTIALNSPGCGELLVGFVVQRRQDDQCRVPDAHLLEHLAGVVLVSALIPIRCRWPCRAQGFASVIPFEARAGNSMQHHA